MFWRVGLKNVSGFVYDLFMKTFYFTTVLAGILSGAFAFSLNWSTGLDYSDPYSSMMPIGISMVVGLVTAGAWGGVIGAWWDYKTETN